MAAQQQHPSQVLKLFWDRQAAQAAAAALAAAASSAAPPTAGLSELPGSSAAQLLSGAPPAAVSRYRSDFKEENRLGQGGFGVVVAAVNRCAWEGIQVCMHAGQTCLERAAAPAQA